VQRPWISPKAQAALQVGQPAKYKDHGAPTAVQGSPGRQSGFRDQNCHVVAMGPWAENSPLVTVPARPPPQVWRGRCGATRAPANNNAGPATARRGSITSRRTRMAPGGWNRFLTQVELSLPPYGNDTLVRPPCTQNNAWPHPSPVAALAAQTGQIPAHGPHDEFQSAYRP